MMIDRNRYANLAEALADVTDIGKVVRAVVRETAIREMMAETGESREAVTTVADAAVSMDEEAVLDLMDGEPTTLSRALARYVEELETRDELQPRDRIVGELDTLIRYPWPGVKRAGAAQTLEVREPDDEHLEIWIGGRKVAGANYDNHGWSGMAAVLDTARAVYEAATGAAPAEDELARFRDDVAVTLRRMLEPLTLAANIGVATAEIENLAKDRFFPDR
jgi:hypothetical protein